MAEISLSAYQDQLASYLTADRYEEVIAHARHILKSLPKNLRAYQQLGDALFAVGRMEEAAEVIRRMLGARPQDFKANSQLAQVYQQLGQGRRALWHAERAFDQQPNNRDTIDLIRRLTLEERGQYIERMQLTAAALAQQHVRNNLFSDALDVLNAALKRSPERIDLQLLRARALWLDGQRMAAAEAADEILQTLPYSIIANRILAELWLAEQRPSDARAYLARIEALDPYLARQLATSESPSEDLVKLEELDYSSIPRHEQAIVHPDWLDSLRDSEAGADSGAIFGAEEGYAEEYAAAAPPSATGGLDDLLADDEIENLFQELIAEENDASAPLTQADDAQQDDGRAVIGLLEEEGFMVQAAHVETSPTPSAAQDHSEGALDEDLARVLEQLEADDDDENSWVAGIQQSAAGMGDDESQQYIEDEDRDWLLEPEADEEGAGAPWLSAAMREMMTENEAGDEFDLFAEDDNLQQLLNRASDTEPIQVDDIQSWLDMDELNLDETAQEAATGLDGLNELNELDELDVLDEELLTLPSDDWLDEEHVNEATVAPPAPPELNAAISDEDQNQLNSDLIDSWQSELEDDDDEDPYFDWLSEDTAAGVDEELDAFALNVDKDEDQAESDAILDAQQSPTAETARAWGLKDQGELADFVEDEARLDDGEAAPSWLNAMVPGLDRERDAEPDQEMEFAQAVARPQQEFGWVNDIVDEETGEMAAIQEPITQQSAMYFRFTKPPIWLSAMQAESQSASSGAIAPLEAVAALSVVEDIDELELDDLTFDDYFNFDTPTDKMDVINLDGSGDGIDFSELGWDDYFDFDSPTEQTIAITLDEEAQDLNFEELGVEDEDFDYDTPTDKMPAITLQAELDTLEFEDIGLDDDAAADDRDKKGGNTTL